VRFAFVFVVTLVATIFSALAEEWSSRTGNCYDWEGTWRVREERQGLWVGHIDFFHVGGSCSGPGTGEVRAYDVRVAIVGEDLFGYRTAGPSVCLMHGNIGTEGVNGFELCSGASNAYPFALRFSASR
jgi:hypothetical protein